MSDGFQTNPGSGGNTFGSDDVGGTHYPRIKTSVGPDGVAQDCWTSFRRISTATTNAVNVKSARAALGFIYAVNLNAAVRYLKLYDKASAPTVGTDTPVATLPIPGSTTGAGFQVAIPEGVEFLNGLSYALTVSPGDNATDAVAANEIFLWGGYA